MEPGSYVCVCVWGGSSVGENITELNLKECTKQGKCGPIIPEFSIAVSYLRKSTGFTAALFWKHLENCKKQSDLPQVSLTRGPEVLESQEDHSNTWVTAAWSI